MAADSGKGPTGSPARGSRQRLVVLSLGPCLVAAVAACSGNAAPYTTDADRGSTHALVTVERRDEVGAEAPSQNRAFATFVRTPPEADPAQAMRVAGLDFELPELGECRVHGREGSAVSPLQRVELLDAGDVTLETAEGRVELAPRPFPAVTSLLSGVIYTSRERVAALPAGEAYALSASGGALSAPLAVSAEAPSVLTGVTLGGVPLTNDAALNPNGAALEWAPGAPRDLVYVRLTLADGTHRLTCAFRDDLGRGALPASAIPDGTSATLALHRLRSVRIVSPESAIDAGELRFDFELSASVAVRAR